MAIKRHVVMIPSADGSTETRPMKEWLREDRSRMPPHLDPDPSANTSHQIRSGLRKMGWAMEETDCDVRLISPIIGAEAAVPQGQDADADGSLSFALEYQLRDSLPRI